MLKEGLRNIKRTIDAGWKEDPHELQAYGAMTILIVSTIGLWTSDDPWKALGLIGANVGLKLAMWNNNYGSGKEAEYRRIVQTRMNKN